MERALVCVGIASLMLAACGSAERRAGGEGTERPMTNLLYTCGYGAFDPDKLEGPGELEHSDSALGHALRDLLSTPDGTMGGKGWRVVFEKRNRAVVAAPTQSKQHPYVAALFERSGDRWEPQGWGECLPRAVVGDRSPATWRLATRPDDDDTELELLVEERACAGGRKLTEDNTRADIRYSEDEIAIVVSADSLSTGNDVAYTCIAPPPSRVTIELEEPVEGRRLMDAGSYPPTRRDG